MSYYVYMLKSKGINSVTYVGYTKNIKERLLLHNSGKGAKSTRGRKWMLLYLQKERGSQFKLVKSVFGVPIATTLRLDLHPESEEVFTTQLGTQL